VEKGSIKLDLSRRDFTINTLAIQLNPKGFGEIIDFFGGMKDIKEKVVRVLHNLSFVEDPTRIFRAIRFEQRLGFQIGKHTQNLMKNSVRMGFLGRLSGGRVLSELILILKEDNPIPALNRMKDFDLLRFLHPNLKLGGEAFELFERIHHVTSWFDLLFLEEQYDRWLIYFYGLMDGLKGREIEEMGQHLCMNEREQKRTVEGKRQADQTLLLFFSWINTGYLPKRSEIYASLDSFSIETKLFMMAKTNQTTTRRYLSLYFTQLKDVKPLLRGADLIEMGMKPGPFIKKTLSNLLKARLDEQVMTQQDEFEFIFKERTVEP
jgi:tRNA nucleotidyltransferase (CCA-adding enzyme)